MKPLSAADVRLSKGPPASEPKPAPLTVKDVLGHTVGTWTGKDHEMKIGPKMKAVATFVAANPGCSMMQAAAAVGPNGSLKFGYRAVHRAIDAGLVVRRPSDIPQRRCDLYPAK